MISNYSAPESVTQLGFVAEQGWAPSCVFDQPHVSRDALHGGPGLGSDTGRD